MIEPGTGLAASLQPLNQFASYAQRYILRAENRSAVGAADSPKNAEIIKDAGGTIPLFPGVLL